MENKLQVKSGPYCKHFVARKKRFCRMTLKKGEEYCGEHMPTNSFNHSSISDKSANLRIVCPLDNKHTCYANKLSKHLKICNARQGASLPYILKGINCGDVIPDISNDGPLNVRSLSNISVALMKDVIAKINKLHDDILKVNLSNKVLKHPIVEEEILKPEYGDRTKKHLYQASSILGHLEEYNILKPGTCYVEFGAGKGQLSYWISKATESIIGSSVLLIERASHRHKLDNKLDKNDGKVHRIRADIGDLVLDKVNILSNIKYVVGVTKHLCGDATDLALRCLKNYQDQNHIVSGIVMAFCCHHRCQWSAYTGKKFFEDYNLSRKDFDIMCGMVSWATCGTGFSRDKNCINEDDFKNDLATMNDRDKEIGLSRQGKEEIGKKCKIILNYGRMIFLEQIGFKCELNYYVTPEISLENLCIVAFKENTND